MRNEEKFKLQPNIHKIEQYQQDLEDIENYETQGTIIRNKEKLILNEEKPAKYLFLQEKQKQNKKHITFLQNEKGKLLKTNSKIFKKCQNFFQTPNTEQITRKKTQNQLLQNISQKVSETQNSILTKEI